MTFRKIFQISALIAWTLFCAWAVTITILSSLSGEQLSVIPGNLLNWDKIIHAIAFGAGALLLTLALHGSRPGWSRKKLALAVLFGMAICGALDEYHQEFTPGRSGGDILDWTADMIGSLVVAGLYYWGCERIHGNMAAEKP